MKLTQSERIANLERWTNETIDVLARKIAEHQLDIDKLKDNLEHLEKAMERIIEQREKIMMEIKT